ncbi:hypothetical protein OPV22_018606 [Ensete ventricosum]|uniref:Uncharacterized protein n=1 Tax=Ensete ventricosum TaxID=4639 RepID=A0AAV8QW01_ENSVE|nr:hypothetical protein OPV22_018606 [Ensete ventricosum]
MTPRSIVDAVAPTRFRHQLEMSWAPFSPRWTPEERLPIGACGDDLCPSSSPPLCRDASPKPNSSPQTEDGESGFGWILMVLIAGDRDAIGKTGFGFLLASLFCLTAWLRPLSLWDQLN